MRKGVKHDMKEKNNLPPRYLIEAYLSVLYQNILKDTHQVGRFSI